MKGFPLIQWILFVVVWGLLLWPLTALTTHNGTAASRNSSPPVRHVNLVWATMRFAHMPESFQLLQGETVLWEEEHDVSTSLQKQIELSLDEGRAELKLNVAWPEGTGMTAAECTLAPDVMNEKSAVFWGRGTATGLLIYEWPEGR